MGIDLKIALITDTHWGIRGNNPNFYNSFDKFFSKTFFPICKEHNISRVIHLGDVFDNRQVLNIKTLDASIKSMLKPLEDNGMTMDVILGNHDVYYKNTNDVSSVEAVLGKYDCVNIHKKPTEITINDQKIALIPWINPENYSETMTLLNHSNAKIVMGHLEIAGFEMYTGSVCHDGLSSKIFSRFETVFSGHFHKKSSSNGIYYLGSIGQYTWSDYGEPRGFHIYDTETQSISHVLNNFELFSKLTYDDRDKEYHELLLDFNPSDIKGKYIKLYIDHNDNSVYLSDVLDYIEHNEPIRVQIINNVAKPNIDLTSEENVNDEDTLSILTNEVENYSQQNLSVDEVKNYIISTYNRAQDIE